MPFNADKFERATFEARTARVAVPALAPFFDADEEAEFVVRGLSATELHRAMEAGKRQSSVEQIVKAIAASGDQAEAVRRALGLTKDTPGEIAKRLEMLVMGAVSPAMISPSSVKPATAPVIEAVATSTLLVIASNTPAFPMTMNASFRLFCSRFQLAV